jgi:hypothetical protein
MSRPSELDALRGDVSGPCMHCGSYGSVRVEQNDDQKRRTVTITIRCAVCSAVGVGEASGARGAGDAALVSFAAYVDEGLARPFTNYFGKFEEYE